MEIIAHRGFLEGPAKPGDGQLGTALSHGFGVEFDIRDSSDGIVLAHDPWESDPVHLGRFLSTLPAAGTLAINIKSCGLASRLRQELDAHGVSPARCFCFDMAVPDHLSYPKNGLPAYARLSELEPLGDFARKADGIWLDGFESTWWDCDMVESLLRGGSRVCVVSPDLHRRNWHECWAVIRESGLHLEPGMALCTDYSFEARAYFR